MRFLPTGIEGAYLIDIEPVSDDRGFFARTFCAREFAQQGLVDRFDQCSISMNRLKGTLRGMHFQHRPAVETKLVRCTAGAIYDVIVDLRPDSTTYGRHFGVELHAGDGRGLYVPELVAHGFQTLEPDSVVFYQIAGFYSPAQSAGVRFDDPRLGIAWPLPPTSVSARDRALPSVEELRHQAGLDL